jgi:putative ABC transport system permease protein
MDALWEDARFAARMLARNKLVTAAAAGALALGMGMNTAIYSGVSGILWNTMPYPQSERLVSLWGANPQRGITQASVSWEE